MSDDEFPRPITTVDLVILALVDDELRALLTRRAVPPYQDAWALPGGWIHPQQDVDIEAAARRVLLEKTGVAAPYLEQLGSFGDAHRDPRGWTISIAYVALIAADVAPRPGGTVSDVAWWPVVDDGVDVPLAFDHAAILRAGLARVRGKVEYSSLPAFLLPDVFTLSELQALYERILGRRLDKSAFRKRMAEVDFAEPVAGAMRRGSNRPAQLYRLREGQGAVLFDRVI